MRIEEDIPMRVIARSTGGTCTLGVNVVVENDVDNNYQVRLIAELSTYGCDGSARSIDGYQVFDLEYKKLEKSSQYRPIVKLGACHNYGCDNGKPLGDGEYDNPLTETDFELFAECFSLLREVTSFIRDILIIGVESVYDLMKAVLGGIEEINEHTRKTAKMLKKSKK